MANVVHQLRQFGTPSANADANGGGGGGDGGDGSGGGGGWPSVTPHSPRSEMNHPVLVRAPSGEGFEDITPINLSPDGTGTVELVDGEEEFPFDTPALAVRSSPPPTATPATDAAPRSPLHRTYYLCVCNYSVKIDPT
jgi:hypothetical protein|eukprot:COSAG06_NODE_1543_length_9141_cov_4.266202_13_plen_138_part_00